MCEPAIIVLELAVSRRASSLKPDSAAAQGRSPLRCGTPASVEHLIKHLLEEGADVNGKDGVRASQ
jgi:hypothetical protein